VNRDRRHGKHAARPNPFGASPRLAAVAREIAIMKVNPFYDSWQFVLGRTADHGNAGPFVGLMVAGSTITYRYHHRIVALSTENRLPARSGGGGRALPESMAKWRG